MSDLLVALGAAGLMGVAALGGLLSNRYSRWGRFRRARRVAIADLRDGQVAKVQGRVRHLEAPLAAPLTDRPCAYYEVEVTEISKRPAFMHPLSWRTRVRESKAAGRFLVEDGTGAAVVETAGMRVLLNVDSCVSSGFGKDPAPGLEAFLSSRGESSTGLLFNKELEYEEGILEEGEEVAVMGLCRLEPSREASAPRAGYREAGLQPRLAASRKIELLVTDQPSLLDTSGG